MGASAGMSLADLTNIIVMMIVLVCFFVMLLLLLRNMSIIGITGEGELGRMPWEGMVAAPRPPCLLMQRVHIPFTFKLCDPKSTTYSDVACTVSSSVRYERSCWWGAPVLDLHAALWRPLHDMINTERLTSTCRHHTPLVRSNSHEERTFHLGLDSALDLGAPPRTCYPLVVVLSRDQQDTSGLRPDDTVALITVVHIQDEICPLPTGILAQYLKQANGQLSCLKQLYVTGESACEEEAGGAYRAGGALCCVCTARPLSRALLPCRHACLCAHCFPKLDKCPICRSPIKSYFCIRAEEEPAGGAPVPAAGARKAPPRWLLAWNDRLIDFLGFH